MKRFYTDTEEITHDIENYSDELYEKVKDLFDYLTDSGFTYRDFLPMLLFYSSLVSFDYQIKKDLK